MTCRPSRGKLPEPLTRDCLEASAFTLHYCGLRGLALSARIGALSDQLTRRIALFPSLLESNIGISSKRKQALLASESIFGPPPLTTGRGDQQIQPARVEEFARFDFRLSLTNGGIGKHF